ncbi:helix-turn-helix transcriptional regulator [Clostridium sp. DJ247]|uniref:helix-turn-helix domain-containing protein n=1 Tax=Clostridium sp. DJ247 TaxID=2726188 RepID=UPI0016262680|nr:helix-turn-helix transcriptional regulator [Clostridium sp. DJ247]MBC2580828.1 helix-turn-helix transcriptional regulator [Clostridium sp. DJ247]
MIKIYISDLLGKYKKNQAWLASVSGIRPATISSLYYEKVKRIELDQLEAIYKAFKQLDNSIKFSDIVDIIDSDNEEKAED